MRLPPKRLEESSLLPLTMSFTPLALLLAFSRALFASFASRFSAILSSEGALDCRVAGALSNKVLLLIFFNVA